MPSKATEIQPERDVINNDCEGFALASRALAAAAVTQLFSYMVGKSIQYGYVCTGQVFVFLYIPDDPATVFYHVCVPNLDVVEDDENRLHRTTVAQVFAFIIQALRTPQPPPSWNDAAQRLETWDVEFEDVLSKIPATDRKDKERASPYKPQRWRGSNCSPIRTRSHCKQSSIDSGPRHENDDELPPPPFADAGSVDSFWQEAYAIKRFLCRRGCHVGCDLWEGKRPGRAAERTGPGVLHPSVPHWACTWPAHRPVLPERSFSWIKTHRPHRLSATCSRTAGP